MAEIEKLMQMALERASSLGASYVDCRYVEIAGESLSYLDGAPEAVSKTKDIGFGVRVLADGAWGFFGSSVLSEKEARRAAEMAVEIGKASARLNKAPVQLAPVEAYTDDYRSRCKTDPFSISIPEKMAFLANLDSLMAANSQINSRSASLDFRKVNSYFISTVGSRISQELVHSGVGIGLGIKKSRREQFARSYPQNGGQYETKGYELLGEYDFAGEIPRLTEEAIALSAAADCPAATTTVILESSVVGLVIHELVGHPLELDRVFGAERNFSGTSFATTDQLGKLQYAAPIVNFTTDATHPYGLGSFGYDDEGVKAHSVDLVKGGLLAGYLSSRETAARISRASSGAMRAEGWGNIPIIRMTNTNIAPGDKTLEGMISDVDDGLYLSTISSWSPSDDRSSFEFGCEIAWEIKGGKLGQIIKIRPFPAARPNSGILWRPSATARPGKSGGRPTAARGSQARTPAPGREPRPFWLRTSRWVAHDRR